MLDFVLDIKTPLRKKHFDDITRKSAFSSGDLLAGSQDLRISKHEGVKIPKFDGEVQKTPANIVEKQKSHSEKVTTKLDKTVKTK